MTTLPLTIGSTDFKGIVAKYKYSTSLTPVYGKTYTNLDGVERTNIKRWRGGLEIETGALTQAQVSSLYSELRNGPVSVTYYNFQLGQQVTQTMKVEADSVRDEAYNIRLLGKVKLTQL